MKSVKTNLNEYDIYPVYTHCINGCMKCTKTCDFGIIANTEIIKGGGYE